jgi:hypothetical protein
MKMLYRDNFFKRENMLDFKNISNQKLHQKTIDASRAEKSATIFLLKHLQEVGKRKIYLDFNHSTLHKYVVAELGYSADEAWSRIMAMRLVAKSKVAEEKISTGDLSLSNAATLQKYSKELDFSVDSSGLDQLVLDSINKSARDLKADLENMLGRKIIEKKIVLNEEMLKLIDEVRGEFGEISEAQIFQSLLEAKIRSMKLKMDTDKAEKVGTFRNSRYIPIQVKREVVQRCEHRCEYVGLKGERCQEHRYLQYDHQHPYCMGGDNSAKNIRMLCWSHNQRLAPSFF